MKVDEDDEEHKKWETRSTFFNYVFFLINNDTSNDLNTGKKLKKR